MPLLSSNSHLNSLSEAWQLWSFLRGIRSFEEKAKNTSREAWKDGNGFVATAVALLFPFGGIWQETVKYHLFAGLEEMPGQVFWRRNYCRNEGNDCGISCQGCRWFCLRRSRVCRRQPGCGLLCAPRRTETHTEREGCSVHTAQEAKHLNSVLLPTTVLLQRVNHRMVWAGKLLKSSLSAVGRDICH